MNRTGLIVVAVAIAAGASAVPYVVLNDGRQQTGMKISARSDGTVVLTTPNGQMQFPRGQYKQAVADKPADLDRLIAAAARTPDQAIPGLVKIVDDYRFLHWDQPAALAAGKAFLAKNQPAQAASVMEKVMDLYPALEADVEFGWVCRSAMLAAGQAQKLEPKLAKLIESGDAANASRALVLRGDLNVAANKMEYAMRDYLRVILFYERQSDVMPMALSRAAGLLEKLRDPRAKSVYQRLVAEYPESPEALAANKKQ